MARHTTVRLVDDLDGGGADTTINFALDGALYEIDLSSKHADEFGAALAKYIGAARRAGGRRAGGRRSPSNSASGRTSDSSAVRAWAVEGGIEMSSRGRIPADVQAKYDAAHE